MDFLCPQNFVNMTALSCTYQNMNANTVSQNALSILSATNEQEVISATIMISVLIYLIRLLKIKVFYTKLN